MAGQIGQQLAGGRRVGVEKLVEEEHAHGDVYRDECYFLAAFKGNPAQTFKIPPSSRVTDSASRELAHQRPG